MVSPYFPCSLLEQESELQGEPKGVRVWESGASEGHLVMRWIGVEPRLSATSLRAKAWQTSAWLERLEPCALKGARTVLRGGGAGNSASLPDPFVLTTTGEFVQEGEIKYA